MTMSENPTTHYRITIDQLNADGDTYRTAVLHAVKADDLDAMIDRQERAYHMSRTRLTVEAENGPATARVIGPYSQRA